jgi:DNA-binding beta-propeller fold protein YncE
VRRYLFLIAGMLLVVMAAATPAIPPNTAHPASAHGRDYEVWVVDQSDTTADGGGRIYVYQGRQLNGRDPSKATAEVIDLGGAARDLCLAQTGSAPRRPHMLMFNGPQAHAGHARRDGENSHAILTFVATGHVLFIDAPTRAPLACIDAGVQAHAATPAPDQTYAVVANQNGKLLQRIITDYATNTFTLDDAATLDLATCTTPTGAACEDPVLRPDNAPICPIVESGSHYTFVTLRGGGLFVVDTTATPMRIVAEYDRETIHPNGCGGVEHDGTMYINAGGGTPANPVESDLYAFDLSQFPNEACVFYAPNTPAARHIFSHDDRGFVDSHGAVPTGNGRYLWLADRAANLIVVVDMLKDTVVNEIPLTGRLSDDPAPDLLDIARDGKRVFVTMRGPNPLTANVPDVNNAVGSTPGLGVIQVDANGRRGKLIAVISISNVVNGVEQADPHGIAVRRTR